MTRRDSPGCGSCAIGTSTCPPRRARTRCIGAAVVLGAKGGLLAEVTVGDVLELLDAEADGPSQPDGATAPRSTGPCTSSGILSADAPTRCGSCAAPVSARPSELIDRFDLACRPVRDLLVDYLRERAPALDYSSLRRAGRRPGERVLDRPRTPPPGIDSLHLAAEVAAAWKQRLRTRQQDGHHRDRREDGRHRGRGSVTANA